MAFYRPPTDSFELRIQALLPPFRGLSRQQTMRLNGEHEDGPELYCAGDADLLKQVAVAVVGSRNPTKLGIKRARRLTRELVEAGVVIVSGLAKGIDTAAHTTAIESGGSTVAIIGTPLDEVTPKSNAALQQVIYEKHLLISPFRVGDPVYRSNFPRRNRIMAALTDATVIIEAGETSGTLHQARECSRLRRPVFIPRSLLTEHRAKWPQSFIDAGDAVVFSEMEEVLSRLPARG